MRKVFLVAIYLTACCTLSLVHAVAHAQLMGDDGDGTTNAPQSQEPSKIQIEPVPMTDDTGKGCSVLAQEGHDYCTGRTEPGSEDREGCDYTLKVDEFECACERSSNEWCTEKCLHDFGICTLWAGHQSDLCVLRGGAAADCVAVKQRELSLCGKGLQSCRNPKPLPIGLVPVEQFA